LFNDLQRMQQSGAFLTTSESIIFQLIGDSTHEKFKPVAGLIKDHTFSSIED
jgi:hypothetical protein